MLFSLSSYIWLGLSILFGIVEIVTTTMVSIWFVAGAVAALLVSLITDIMIIQVLVFIAVSGTTLYFTRPFLVDKFLKKTPTNADMIIGKTAVVTQRISEKSSGRVKIEGLTWRAVGANDFIEGEDCTVIRIEGATLVVEKQLVTQ